MGERKKGKKRNAGLGVQRKEPRVDLAGKEREFTLKLALPRA